MTISAHFFSDERPYVVRVNVWNEGKSAAQQSYAVLRDWCNENCRGSWSCILMSFFEFECKEDAAMFKLFLI